MVTMMGMVFLATTQARWCINRVYESGKVVPSCHAHVAANHSSHSGLYRRRRQRVPDPNADDLMTRELALGSAQASSKPAQVQVPSKKAMTASSGIPEPVVAESEYVRAAKIVASSTNFV